MEARNCRPRTGPCPRQEISPACDQRTMTASSAESRGVSGFLAELVYLPRPLLPGARAKGVGVGFRLTGKLAGGSAFSPVDSQNGRVGGRFDKALVSPQWGGGRALESEASYGVSKAVTSCPLGTEPF